MYFPTYKFVGEEGVAAEDDPSASTLTDAKTWVVDPVDGTTNFVHGFPFVAVSIALLQNKKPIIGVVYNPILDELFSALESHGAHLNSQYLPLLPPTPLESLEASLLATEYGYERDGKLDRKLETISSALKSPARGIRSLGSAALEACYVARGCLDAYWEAGVHMWGKLKYSPYPKPHFLPLIWLKMKRRKILMIIQSNQTLHRRRRCSRHPP
jgi:fructose-1,6-bisphosphatase/inositol monophosphatase family enzyme